MDALHTAATNFVNMWGSLPPATGSAGPDSIGVVVFDTSSPLSPLVPLTDVTNPANRTSVISAVNAVMPGGSTSIGAGLQRADAMLAPVAGRRKVALLMSDGQQNTDPWVDASTGLVATFCLFDPVPCLGGIGIVPTSKVPLTNQPRIYTVTLGPTVSAAINQDIAIKSKGFYLNTEEPGGANLLSPFFLELLQNFLRFNSYETVRMISETTSYSAKIPISTTSLNAAFSLMWPSRLGPLRLTITPPGGAQPIVQENALGFISVVQSLPLPAPFDPTGDWKVQVEAVNPGAPTALAKTGTQGSIPFDLHLMTDDTGIKTDLAIVPGDYKPGSEIKLRAKLTRFGLPILGLGSHPGDRIEVELIRPGESIGDMLSDSTASAVPSCPPSGPCDRQSPAEAKLANTLAQDPSKLKRVKAPSVALYDDGKPEHGDDVAGDGIYNALYTADMPGHYNFLFAAESTDPNTVRFSRQQLRTAYVRAVPDSDKTKTTFQTSIQPCLLRTAPVAGPGTTTNTSGSACNTLVITMKPRTKFGNRMGPGWANYFWFTSPGVASANAIRATDNPKLDGTYTATLNFTGNKPPDVFLHFEDVIAVIGDSVTQDQLPQKLDGGNALTKVPPPSSGNWAAFLDLGAGFPIGTFSSAFNTGFSLNAGLEYIINPHISAEGIFGYHHFPAKVGLNLNVYQFSANAKFYLTAPPNKWRPFLNFGPGAYKFSLGSSNIGGNFGAGILREFAQPLGGRFGLQGSYNFHITNSSGGATKFSTLQGGIRYVF
jgi:hypothetical protein